MCGSMADIQSATAEIRRGKKIDRKKKKPQGKNVMVCPIPQATIETDSRGVSLLQFQFA